MERKRNVSLIANNEVGETKKLPQSITRYRCRIKEAKKEKRKRGTVHYQGRRKRKTASPTGGCRKGVKTIGRLGIFDSCASTTAASPLHIRFLFVVFFPALGMHISRLVSTHLDKRDILFFLTDGRNFVDVVRMSDVPDLKTIGVSEQ